MKGTGLKNMNSDKNLIFYNIGEGKMEYHKIHLTHVLVSGEWVLAQVATFGLMNYYHVLWSLYSFLTILAYVGANSYFLSKWTINDTGITQESNKP